MTKARIARTKKKASIVSSRKRSANGKKRFKASSGRYAQITVLDANAASFGTDLLKVFRENVTKAREENMRLFGSADRAPDRE
jgi:hypothetical protein